MAKNSKMNLDQRVKKIPISSSWINNIAKSVGFAGKEIVKELVPNTINFVENNEELLGSVRNIRENAGIRNTINKQLSDIPQIGIGKDMLKNALDDIKSGKIYNNDRLMEGFDDDFDDMDFGFDLFDEDDDLSFGDEVDFDDGDTVTLNKNTVNNVVNTLPLAKSMAVNTEMTITAMSAIAEQNLAVESEKMVFNHKAASSILGGLSAINDNVATLVKFHSDSTAGYHAASLKYYEESITALQNMQKLYGIKGSEEDKDKKHSSSLFDSMYDFNGGLKIDKYFQTIKKNVEDIRDESIILSSMSDIVSDLDTWKDIARNPLGELTKKGIRTLIPKMTSQAIKALDESLSGVLPAILGKINTLEDSDSIISEYIYKIFGSKNKLSYHVDMGKYERGAIPWDGEAKKALVEVIPAHFRRIEAALTGQQERVFDYTTGKFSTADEIKKRYNKKLTDAETSGYGDIKTYLREFMMGINANSEAMEEFDANVREYLSEVTKKGALINPFVYKDSDGMETDELLDQGFFNGDEDQIRLFRAAMKGLSSKQLSKLATTYIYDSRANAQKFMDDVRQNPNISGYNIFNSEDKKTTSTNKAVYNPGGKTNNSGLSHLDYLSDIRSILLNGVRVYPKNRDDRGNLNPNELLEHVRKTTTNLGKNHEKDDSKSRSTFLSSYNKSLSELYELSDDDLAKAVQTIKDENAVKFEPKTKLGKMLNNRDNVINKYIVKATDTIDEGIYKILFDSDGYTYEDLVDKARGKITDVKDGKGKLGSMLWFVQDTIKGVGSYFTGNDYINSKGELVKGDGDAIFKRIGRFLTKSTKSIFGDKDKGEKGLIRKFSDSFMDGYKQFKTTLFGEKKLTDKDKNETLAQLTDKVKQRLPKSIGAGLVGAATKTVFASKLGLLGSVLLPGGPIGAAITGTAMGFIGQSDTFKNWLFGEKNLKGQRMGGFVPKSLVDMLDEHGATIKKGAMVGGVVGLLPSFFLPGGPITGAIMGVGTGLLTKSDAFQEFLYGEEFKDKDKRKIMNGAFGKLYRKTLGAEGRKINPKLATFLGATGAGIGVAQGVGLLPSFLLPGGPIAGAMLGLAGGIMASSDKFQQFLFGDKDIDGKRYGGLMTKFTNWFDATVVTPFKIKAREVNDNIYDFFQNKIASPFLRAFDPITQAMKFAVNDAKDAMVNTWHRLADGVIASFNDNVIKPFGESLEKYVVNPLKKTFNMALGLLGKGLGALISTPFKLLERFGDAADSFNARHVLKEDRKKRIEEKGLIRGFFISKSKKEKLLDEALPYRRNREAREQERQEKIQSKLDGRKAKREEMLAQYEEDREFGRKSNWKYASKRQKEQREKDLKDKVEWMNQRNIEDIRDNGDEAVKKLSAIQELMNKVPSYEDKKLEVLTSMKKSVLDSLDKLIAKGYDGGEKYKGVVNALKNKLEDDGQSHADGLDNVPKDGYLAQLHEGEMVVPKKGAGVLRNILGKKSDSKNNSIVQKLFGNKDDKDDSGILGNMFKKMSKSDNEDRADNSLYLSDVEQKRMKEMLDMERYEQVSRKSVDFIQNQREQEKKEKEDKLFREELLEAIKGGTAETKKGNSFWENMFGAQGLLGKFFGGGLANLLSKLLGGGLGGLLGGVGPMLAAVPAIVNYIEEKEKQAEENGVSLKEAMDGVGDVGQLNVDGLYARDNTGDNLLKTTIRNFIPTTYNKVIKPTIEGGKAVYPTVKKGVNGIKTGLKNTATAYDNYINPKMVISGKTVLGDTYTDVTKLERKGLQKPLGAISDFNKKLTSNAKDGVTTLINACKTALGKLEAAVAKKIPGVSGLASSLDNVFKRLAASSDVIWRKFGDKIQLYVIDGAADFIPIIGQVTEAAMVAWDVGTGLTAGNAGNLFQVQTNEVDLNMRLITSVMQGACKFSWFSIIWLVNEINSSLYDQSFLTEIARQIYRSTPKFVGKKIDMNSKLTREKVDNASSVEELIIAAGGDPKEFKGKKIEDLKSSDLTGISATDLQEIKRFNYNKENGTQMDRQGFADETSKTVGQKLLGNKFVKNFKGTFSKRSARGHLGTNNDAKLTFGERTNFAIKKTGLNMYNSVAKLFGKDQIDDNEWFRTKDYDENGKKVKKGTGSLTYAEAREKKYQAKVDKANAKINKRLENEPKSGIGKWFNNMMIGVQKGKREKARKRIGTKKKKQTQQNNNILQDQISEEFVDYNSANSNVTNSNMSSILAALEEAGFNGGDTDSYGKGDDGDTKAALIQYMANPKDKAKANGMVKVNKPKSKDNKKNNADMSIIDKSSAQINKELTAMFKKLSSGTKKTTTNMTKALTKGNTLLTKDYNDQQKAISKSAKDLSRKLDKQTDKNDKDLQKNSKKVVTSTEKLLKALKKKIDETASDIKNIKVSKVNTISPTFEIDDPKKFMTDLFNDVFAKTKKPETSSTDKKKKKDNNAGSSGITLNERREFSRINVSRQTSTSDNFISPSTTNNNTTNSTNNKFVFYNQADQRWGDKALIGGKTIKDAGCGPTSLAMAISQMTGEMVTPDVIAQLGAEHLPGYSAYSLFPTIANKLNMNYEEGKNDKDVNFITNKIKRGLPVLLSGKSNGKGTPFTKEGHIVTATQVKGDSVFIQDPRGKEYSKFYKIKDIMSGLKKSMVLSPSARTRSIGIPSAGKLDINTKGYNGFNSTPLGIYGDGPSVFEEGDAGKAGAQVRVADRVLSYMRAFLNQKSKFAYSQPLRDEINHNKSHADCSSFVSHVLTVAGDTPVNATSETMWNSIGTKVDTPQIGDIVCQQGHVGLYSGDGKYIHMSTPKGGIKESPVKANGNKPHRGYKRVLKNPSAMVDAIIRGGNSLLGTVTATESGMPLEGGAISSTGPNTGGESAEMFGIFSKMGNIGQNMVASIFNGKQVDLFGSNASVESGVLTPTATINGKTVKALFSAYYPANTKLQGGFNDASGNRLDPSKRTCAAPKEVPLGSKIQISGTGTEKDGQIYTVNDRGGAIKVRGDEYQFDLLMADKTSAYSWGKKKGQATIGDSSNAGMGEGELPYIIDGFENESYGKDPATATSAETYSGSGIPDSMNGWAYYKQGDPRWNKEHIGGSTVGRAGCGPTSHAMMVTTMLGKRITPDIMTKWARAKGGWTRDGMQWTMPSLVASNFGLSQPLDVVGKSDTTLAKIKSEIKAGHPVIMSGRGIKNDPRTPFTPGGHIVLGVGVDGNNNIIINDPRGPQYTKAYTDQGLKIGVSGLRRAWSFAKTGQATVPSSIQTAGDFTPGAYVGSDGTATDAPAAETPEMFGMFSKMGNIAQNMVASIFNGKQVDLFSSPTATSADTTGSTSGDVTSLTGNNVADQIYNFARQKGCTPQAAAGLVGNADCESNFNPSVVNSIGASGLFQWLGPRKTMLKQRAAQAGKDWTDVLTQLNFLWWELEGGESGTKSRMDKRIGGFEGYKKLTDAYKAGYEFGYCFERGGHNETRGRKAQEWYNKFQSMGKGPDEKDKYDKIINIKKSNDIKMSGSAGKGGDGKMHIIQPAVDKNAKPVTKVAKVKKSMGTVGKGDDQTQQKLRKASSNLLQNMQGAIKKSRPVQTVQSNDKLTSAYLEAMAGVLDELKDINNNTAITAENTSKLKVYSANEPVNNSTVGVQPNKGSNSNRPAANSNTGYELARNIAGFATR